MKKCCWSCSIGIQLSCCFVVFGTKLDSSIFIHLELLSDRVKHVVPVNIGLLCQYTLRLFCWQVVIMSAECMNGRGLMVMGHAVLVGGIIGLGQGQVVR